MIQTCWTFFHIKNTIRSVCLIHTWLDLEFRHTFDFLKSHSNRPERLADFVSLEREGQWHVSMAFFGDDTTGRTICSLLSEWPSYSYNVIFKMLPNRKILLIILYCKFLSVKLCFTLRCGGGDFSGPLGKYM